LAGGGRFAKRHLYHGICDISNRGVGKLTERWFFDTNDISPALLLDGVDRSEWRRWACLVMLAYLQGFGLFLLAAAARQSH